MKKLPETILGTTRAKQIRDRVRELVTYETPSGDAEAITQFTELLAVRWRDWGVITRQIETPVGPVLIGEVEGSGWGRSCDPILLVGHSDTVWPKGTLNSALPWSTESGIIRGPGVYDMKSGLVVIESVVQVLVTERHAHPPLRIFVAPDEETGSTHTAAILHKVVEGCSAALGFESPHPDGALKVGRFGSTRVRISVKGRAAHAALDPESGISAIDELIDQLVRVRGLVERAPASPLGSVLCNVGSFHADGRANVVADSAVAELGLRFPTRMQEIDLLAGILAPQSIRGGAEATAITLSHRPSWTARQRDLDLAAVLMPDRPPGRPARGAADTNMLGSLALPVVDGLGPQGGGAHALTEHIVEADLLTRINELVSALSNAAHWPPSAFSIR